MTHPVNEEYFDIVDSRDHVVGRAPRREVHARALLHRAVHVLVFDSQGRIFLQKRFDDEGHLSRLLGFFLLRARGFRRGV